MNNEKHRNENFYMWIYALPTFASGKKSFTFQRESEHFPFSFTFSYFHFPCKFTVNAPNYEFWTAIFLSWISFVNSSDFFLFLLQLCFQFFSLSFFFVLFYVLFALLCCCISFLLKFSCFDCIFPVFWLHFPSLNRNFQRNIVISVWIWIF